ncbi:MAG: type II toxin-antitoxin system VapC family toxin [Salinibacter sp.]
MTPPDSFLDTSVVVRAVIENLPNHQEARSYLDRARRGTADIALSTHALAELFATITALPTRPQHSPKEAKALVDGVADLLTVTELSYEDYATALDRMVEYDLSSGAIYDALHVVAAEKTEAAELVTFNGSDFRRMPPKGATELTVLPS